MSFTVAILGRPNVGKSTLFNRLVGKRVAIVHDTPGVTRDRREGRAELAGMCFTVIDTAGLEEAFDDSVEGRMRTQTEKALAEADVALMLVDARAGVTPLDAHFAAILRKSKTPVVLVANKCEGRAGMPGLYEAYSLGLGDPIPVSAEHGEGMDALFEVLLPYCQEESVEDRSERHREIDDDDDLERRAALGADDDDTVTESDRLEAGRPIRVAVVGRPNVGKSTLVNCLLGEERMLTGPEAGLTRDAIASSWQWKGRDFTLVDTAGLRRKAVISDQLEKLSTSDSIDSIRMAQIVILVLDVSMILDKQDLTIARLALSEGRGLVIAVNKWDVVEDRSLALRRLNDRLERSLSQARGVATVTVSALAGRGMDRLMKTVLDVYQVWNSRISTGTLNRWLAEVTAHHPPPALRGGRRIRLRYMTQVKARPPTFVIFASKPDDLPESYVRYLSSGLRDCFNLPGVPLRLLIRKGKNPYAD